MNPVELRSSISLAAVYGLRMLGMFLILPVFALYAPTLEGGNSKAWVGFALGAYGLTQAIFQLPLGIASDRFGRKKIIYIGLLIFVAGCFLAAVTPDIYWLTFARALQGAGAVSAVVTALLADLTREEVRTRAMALIGMTIGLTFALSMVLGPILASWIGLNGIFALTGVLTILSILAIFYFVPNPQKKIYVDAGVQKDSLLSVLKNTQLMRLNFGIFALHGAQMALFMAVPLALVQQGLPVSEHWHIYLPIILLGIILMVPAIIFGERRGKLKFILVLFIFLMMCAQLGLAFALKNLYVISVWLLLYFIAFNVLEAILPSLVSKVAPSGAKGGAMGVFNTAQSLGLFFGGVLGGIIFTTFDFVGIFIFCSILIMIWLWLAWTAPPFLSVKTVILTVGQKWSGQTKILATQLMSLNGTVEVAFSEDEQIVYLKTEQTGFDIEAAQKVILGDDNVSK